MYQSLLVCKFSISKVEYPRGSSSLDTFNSSLKFEFYGDQTVLA